MAFRWWRRRRSEATPDTSTPAPAPAPVAIDPVALAETIDALVLPGFTPFEDVVETVVEVHEDEVDDPETLRPVVERAVRDRWAARLTEQHAWEPGSGQYERLRDAFATLREQGFVTGMAVGVDQADGVAECADARTPDPTAPDRHREWAYVFFHQQDAERLAEPTALLYLAYGAFRPSPDLEPDHVALAEQSADGRAVLGRHSRVSAASAVVAALVDHGLDAEWDGQTTQRITVRIDRWQKPLPA